MRSNTLQSKFWPSTSAKYLVVLGTGCAHSVLGHGPLSSKDIPDSETFCRLFLMLSRQKDFPADRNGKLELQLFKTSWYLKVSQENFPEDLPCHGSGLRSLLL